MSESVEAPDLLDAYIRRVKVERCVDGDTVDCLKDMGERVFKQDRYRLSGIDTPERGDNPGYGMATDHLRDLIELHSDSKGWLLMRTEKHGKFRWLGELLTQDGQSINQMMISDGYAVAYGGGKRG